MPILYQHTINKETRLALWRIEEPADFFLSKINYVPEAMNPKKRLQHVAGRYLLTLLQPDFPLKAIESFPGSKPVLPDHKIHFSISHSGNYAAAILSHENPVGIDVEMISSKAASLQKRFLSENEIMLLQKQQDNASVDLQSTLFWSAKETLFKWMGKKGIDFRNDIQIKNQTDYEEGSMTANILKENTEDKKISFIVLKDAVLSWML